MLIFSEEPWFDWSNLPESSSWWGGILQTIRECFIPACGFATPGALLGVVHAWDSGQSILLGLTVGGVGGAILLYFFLSFIEEVRFKIRTAFVELHMFGHVKRPPWK